MAVATKHPLLSPRIVRKKCDKTEENTNGIYYKNGHSLIEGTAPILTYMQPRGLNPVKS